MGSALNKMALFFLLSFAQLDAFACSDLVYPPEPRHLSEHFRGLSIETKIEKLADSLHAAQTFRAELPRAAAIEQKKAVTEKFNSTMKAGVPKHIKALINDDSKLVASVIWLAIERQLFILGQPMASSLYQRLGDLYDIFNAIFHERLIGSASKSKHMNIDQLLIKWRQNPSDYNLKEQVYVWFQRLNVFFQTFAPGTSWDLFKNAGQFYALFDVSNADTFSPTLNALYHEWHNQVIEENLSSAEEKTIVFLTLHANASTRFDLSSTPIVLSKDERQFIEHITYDSISQLIHLLTETQLPNEKMATLEKFALLRDHFANEKDEFLSRTYYLLFLCDLAHQTYGAIPQIFAKDSDGDSFLRLKNFFVLKMMVERSHRRRVIAEERLSQELIAIESFNERVALLQQDVMTSIELWRGASPTGQHTTETIDFDYFLRKLRDLAVYDFTEGGSDGPELTRRRSDLANLEEAWFERYELFLTHQDNETIVDFEGLNFSWERLVPHRSYRFGSINADYTEVMFNKDVVDYFAHDPSLGSRFLAALSKSYVSNLGSSGLRRLNIHPQFRDIKIVGGKGKKRIIGALVGERIHFFKVYDSEKTYDYEQIKKWVNQYLARVATLNDN